LRLALARHSDADPAGSDEPEEIRSGELTVDEGAYVAKVRGRTLDLTFKEFELLKFLAQHPGRVLTRAVLLQEVWGYDFFGGTRTVRRARASPTSQARCGARGVDRDGAQCRVPIRAAAAGRATRATLHEDDYADLDLGSG
jgi:hypothetical protein